MDGERGERGKGSMHERVVIVERMECPYKTE